MIQDLIKLIAMNYIKHLNGVFLQFSKDNRLNPTHISLYIGLFQIWNYNRFPEEFYVNREQVMKFSKIGSKSTYHRCIRELNHWEYLIYYPSHNPYKGSRIKLFQFGTSDEQVVDLNHPISEQALVPYININKPIENINKQIDKKEVLNFFKNKNWPELQANKFFNHYEAVGWKKSNTPIENWKAAAENWILNLKDKREKTMTPLSHNQDNLHTNQNKNYNEPL